MTLLGTVMQAGISGVLTLAPAAVLKRERMLVTIAMSFLAILAMNYVGGLILGVPVTILLLLFSLWVRFVGFATAGPKRVLFIVTLVLSALFLAQHIVHLPIRFALNQAPVKIASNVAGILLAAAMLCATLESLILRKRKKQETTNQALQATSETTPSAVSEAPVG